MIYLWDAKTLLQVSKILDSPKGIRCLAYMPENDFLFSAGFATFASGALRKLNRAGAARFADFLIVEASVDTGRSRGATQLCGV